RRASGSPPLRVSAFRRRCCPRHGPRRHPACGYSSPPVFSWDPCRRASSSQLPRRPSARRRYRPKIRYSFSYQSLLFGLAVVWPLLREKTAGSGFAKKRQTRYNENRSRLDETEETMTTIYLIRHAEAEGNLYRIAQGQANSIITDRGW